ncbi:unnamed protein product [Callosobruchus maculatus]|uniref:Uncharacterized protein n=1 Tax=Callosobruchus maculatus TaxID=64391 RepID=A0A653D946_CALMS|nr:unnamed protein product [Callosobruchus maculatus]
MFYDSVHSAISESCLLTNSNSNFKKYLQIIVVGTQFHFQSTPRYTWHLASSL